MKKEETSFVIERYNKRLEQFGYSPKTLGWPKGRQNLRFYILLNHWDINGKDILDFGCGFGDMYGYLKEKNYKANYFGIDINKNLISEGRKKYPEAALEPIDVFSEGFYGNYDYIYSSGTHNTKISDNWKFVEKTFELFNGHAKLGFALNFLSDKVDFKEEGAFYYNPSRMLDIAYKYSNRIVLRNDYMPFEFTVFVDKRKDFDKDLVIYPEFIQHI